jgi:hypothetical protein
VLPKRRTLPLRPLLDLKALEDRTLLAGNVTAVLSNAGVLSIVGDSAGNRISIMTDPFGPTRNIRVVGDPGSNTTVNNAAFASFDLSAINDLTADFQDGDDSLHIFGPLPLQTGIPGNVNVNMGTGRDLFVATELSSKTLTFTNTGPGDATVILTKVTTGTGAINTGTGADTLYVNGVTATKLTLNTGKGTLNDFVRVYGKSAFDDLTLVADDGSNNIGVNDTTIAKTLSVTSGKHSSNVDVSRNFIQGNVTIRAGEDGGTNQYVSVNDNTFIRGEVRLTVGDGPTSGATSVTVARNTFNLNDVQITVGNNASSVFLDTLTLNANVPPTGNLSVRIGANARNVVLNRITTSLVTNGNLDLVLGDGAGIVNLINIQSGGNLNVNASTSIGNTAWNLQNVTVQANLTLVAGPSRNTLSLNTISVGQALTVTLGNAPNIVFAHATKSARGFIRGGGNPLSEYHGKFDTTNIGYQAVDFGKYF